MAMDSKTRIKWFSTYSAAIEASTCPSELQDQHAMELAMALRDLASSLRLSDTQVVKDKAELACNLSIVMYSSWGLRDGCFQHRFVESPQNEFYEKATNRITSASWVCCIAGKIERNEMPVPTAEDLCLLADHIEAGTVSEVAVAKISPPQKSNQPSKQLPPSKSKQVWITVSEAAKVSAINAGVISRAVDSGKLTGNGESGRARRIDAASLVVWVLQRADNNDIESDQMVEQRLSEIE